MKKRSLVAALAMLMVSAIVLTSSTYAWFATGTTAKVSNVEASITNNDGSISISAKIDEGYKTSLNKSDLENVGQNYFAETFNPVSFDPEAGTFISGSIAQDTSEGSATRGEMLFTPDTAVTTSYTRYTVFVKASTACKVNVTPTFGTSNVSYAYASIAVDEAAPTIFSATNGRQYNPLLVNAPIGVDANNDKIMSAEDKATDNTSPYTGVSTKTVTATNGSIQLNLEANKAVQLDVYLWAEGQDAACNGPITDGLIQFGIDFAMA